MTSVRAQITPDNSLGAESSSIGPDNIQGISFDRIGGGATRGANLFHSFGEFNVGNGQLVYFSNPAGIANILTRVTGVNRSNILGTLGVLGNANLFLINPNGIFFGPNSSLDVRGSFFGSTANSLIFDNGFEFSATNPQAPPLLTVNIPVGLRFRDNPGNITYESLFPPQVEPGKTLALIGGDVNFNGGSLTALGVNVEIGGLKAPGTVGINNDGSLSFPDGVTRGDISFSNGASVDVRFIGGGSITVNGRNVEISGGSSLEAGIFPGFGMSEAQAGDIVINASDITITGTPNFASTIANTVGSEAAGNAGNIKFNTNNLTLSNGQINSSTSGQGNAGNISLQVGDAIAFTDSSIITANVQQGGSGKSGNIDIRGQKLTVTDGSQIQAVLFAETNGLPGGIGTGGSIKINASDFVDISGFSFSNGRSGIFTSAGTGSTGSAGSIDITTGAFRLANFGIVTATNDNGNNGGNITINAKTFEATNGLVQTALSGKAEAGRLVSAGDIQLKVSDSVTLKDGSRLISSSFGEGNAGNVTISAGGAVSLENVSRIFSTIESTGKGNGGQVNIQAGSLILKDGSTVGVSTFGQGNAGSAIIKVQNTFSADGVGSDGFFSGVYSTVQDNAIGNAGGIDITTKTLSLFNGGLINASTFATGDAGSVKIQASDISLNGVGTTGSSSGIFSTVTETGIGNAGGIDITTATLSLLDGAIINASTFNEGDAGRIKIQASDSITASGVGSNRVTSSIRSNVQPGAIGNAGGIDISTKNLSFTNGAQISAITSGRGNAGSVKIQASDISFDGVSSNGFTSGIFSNVEGDAVGNAGGIDITTGKFSLFNGAQITASTFGNGNAGTVKIQASDISLNGVGRTGSSSGIFSAVADNGRGNAGGIDITTGTLSLFNGAIINASTFARGDAGRIKIQASDTIEASGVGSNDVASSIRSRVEDNAIGNAGGIDITTQTLSFTNGASLTASTFGTGDAGSVKIQASDISFDGVSNNGFISRIFSNVQEDAVGNAGGIDITTGKFSLFNGAQITASTFGNGNAGSVKIQASDISLNGVGSDGLSSGIFSSVATNGRGNAAGIDIITGKLSLLDGAQISASTFGTGDAGNVKIQASDISFDGVGSNGRSSGIFSTVQGNAVGNGGGIDISTGTLSLFNGAIINASTFATGDAGRIKIQASDTIKASGVGSNDVASSIRSRVEDNAIGNAGGIDISTKNLFFANGAQINASTFAQGNAGNVTINASDRVSFAGFGSNAFSSGVYSLVASGAVGNGGNINISTGSLSLSDGAVVNALTSNSGDAGNITINANTFTANSGGQVITTTRSSGSAGNINLNIRDRITISGSDPNYNQRLEQAAQFGSPDDIVNNQGAASGIFANTAFNSTGKGGNITIQPRQNSFPRIAIADGGEVTVDSQGQGVGGEISIRGNTLTLDRGTISASTASADGGNIDLRLRNFLRLQNESLISANAGGQQNGGNGGNITINTPFIVAFPRNNDIIANARSGNGGQVRTNATLFGIVPRTRADLERLGVPDLNPRNLPTSDITAFSEQNSNFGDNVLVTSPDVDPSRGLVELPETVTDPTQRIAQNPCQQGIGNEFVVTGRGGFPTNPNQTLSSDNVRVDLLQPVASSGNSRAAIKPATNPTATRVPAQGWIFNDKGQVVLTAYDPTNTGSQRSFSTAAACPAR
jgi:filamentous hemagglutinin family protein